VVVSRWRLLTILLVTAIYSLSCSKAAQPAVQTSSSSVVTSTPPFKTKEPETYQAVRSISFTPSVSGQSSASTVTIARDGDQRREEDNSGGKRVVYLDLPAGNFVLVPDEKIYAEMVGPGTFVRGQDGQDGFEEVYVHTAPIQSTYQNLGAETVNGTTTTKYRVTVNSETNGSVSESETLIWIDEALGMPVKSETHSEAGTRRTELSKVSLRVDKALFAIPKDYQKVEMQVLQQRIK